MGRLESRITLINYFVYKGKKKNIIRYLLSVNRTIEQIDNDKEIQNVCEHFELKKNKINQLKGLNTIELHDKFVEILTDSQKTNFLIFKN